MNPDKSRLVIIVFIWIHVSFVNVPLFLLHDSRLPHSLYIRIFHRKVSRMCVFFMSNNDKSQFALRVLQWKPK